MWIKNIPSANKTLNLTSLCTNQCESQLKCFLVRDRLTCNDNILYKTHKVGLLVTLIISMVKGHLKKLSSCQMKEQNLKPRIICSRTFCMDSIYTVWLASSKAECPYSSFCTFSAWASSDFKLLVTFFNSSSRSPDLLSNVRKRKSKRRKRNDLKGRTAEEIKPWDCLKKYFNIFVSVLLRERRWIFIMELIS